MRRRTFLGSLFAAVCVPFAKRAPKPRFKIIRNEHELFQTFGKPDPNNLLAQYIRTAMREDSFARKILPPEPLA